MKKRLTKILAGAMALCLLVGTFAYFTDRVQQKATGTSGNVQIESTAFAGSNDANVLVDRDGKDNLNPGDVRDLTFTVSNMGNKAVDLRHTIKLTVLDQAQNALALTQEAGTEQCEFDIYLKDDVTYTPAAGYVIAEGAKPIFSTPTYDAQGNGVKRVVDANTITYYFGTTTLLGKDGADNSERVENAALAASESAKNIVIGDKQDTVTYEYVLVYRNTSLNKFMNSGIQIDMVVEAKQHYNTNNDWTTVATQEFTAGNLTVNATPNHAEDTVGGASVAANNGITAHDAIKGTATKNLLG